MIETIGVIERIRRINENYQYLEIGTEDDTLAKIKPGQSLLVRQIDPDNEHVEHWDPYLREQWFPSGFTESGLLLVERPFSNKYRPQLAYNILGPVGQPYRFRKSLRNVLLVAYDTAPLPLSIMIGQLINNNISVTIVLLGEAQAYNTKHLVPEVEVKRGTDKLEWEDQIMTLGWADQIFVVVKQDDEMARFAEFLRKVEALRVDVPKNYIFGVFQPLLPCGVGACGACMLRINKHLEPACTKGPTFDLTQINLPR